MKAIEPRTCSQADLYRVLGRKIGDDILKAGWIRPRVERNGARGRSLRIFAVEDIRRAEERILKGEYPATNTQKKNDNDKY